VVAIRRGEVWWAELEEPRGSAQGYRRPLVIVQSDAFNRSRINTVIAVVLTSNLGLADAPGNVLLPRTSTGLPRDSVANVSRLITIDRDQLASPAGRLSSREMTAIADGLRLVLSL